MFGVSCFARKRGFPTLRGRGGARVTYGFYGMALRTFGLENFSSFLYVTHDSILKFSSVSFLFVGRYLLRRRRRRCGVGCWGRGTGGSPPPRIVRCYYHYHTTTLPPLTIRRR